MKLDRQGVVAEPVILMLPFCIPFYAAPAKSEFGGINSAMTNTLEENGAKPWFGPIAPPADDEVGSDLFTIRTALGSGIMFYYLGRMTGRRKAEKEVGGSAFVED